MKNLKIGNVGALTNGAAGLWRIVAIDGETITVEQIGDGRKMSTFIENFWPLLDSFN
jgi:hypothetical protein